MTKLEELINELCPDGVENKNLGDMCQIRTGKLNANAKDDNGNYPFFTCDANPYRINNYAFDTSAILISGNGSQVGHINSYEGKFNVVVCQNDNEAYGAMDAMDAAGITYGVDGDVTLISFDATHDGLQYTLDGKINCDVECNPIQAETVKGVIEKMQAGEDYEKTTLVEDQAFVAPGIESEYATTMTDEVLAGRAY